MREVDGELANAIPRVLQGEDDEAIHDLRVAIRRLRTLLKLARPVLGRFYSDTVRAGFTAVHRATGTLRDEEVLDETLTSLPYDSPAFASWRARRKARERTLRGLVVGRLRMGELTRARRLLHALITLPVRPSKDRAAARLARRALDAARREVERRRDAPTEDAVALHELRIAYKELRYAAELLSDALPADLAAMSEPAAKFQKRLGEIHDADVAILAVRRARGMDPGTRAVVVEALSSLRAGRVARFVAEMAPAEVAPGEAASSTPQAEAGSAALPDGAPAREGRSLRLVPGAGARHGLRRSESSRSGKSPAS